MPEARVEFVQVLQDVLDDLAGNPAPIEVKIFGDDPGDARAARAEVGRRASHDLPELVDLFDGVEGDGPS